MLNKILKLFARKKAGVVVFAPNKYAMSLGMKSTWAFDVDKNGVPIFRNASDKAKWEMANSTYSVMFDKFVTE